MTGIATTNYINDDIGSKTKKILKNITRVSFITLGPTFSHWLYKVVKKNEKQKDIFNMVFITGLVDVGKITGELYLLDKVAPYYNNYVMPVLESFKNYLT